MNTIQIVLTKEIPLYTLPASTKSCKSDVLHLVVQEGARVTINEPEQFFGTARTINLELQEGASVEWQGFTNTQSLHETVTVTLGAHATCVRLFSSKHTGLLVGSYTYILAGPQARAMVTGRLGLSQKAVHELTMVQLHTAPLTHSAVDVKTVLDDYASFSYEGTITIKEHATHSQAFQSQKNLVLSHKAQVRSVPNLEALTHEVQCGHGSAVSYMNDDHLFYLQARGLTRELSQSLLIEGFLVN